MWERKNASALTSKQKAQLFAKAILAIELRARVTLSNVTLLAILDRVLCQSKEMFPVLAEARLSSHFISFKALNLRDPVKPDDLAQALRFILLELFRVLGRITADILTIPLHKELHKVSWTEPEET
ncbi:MAG TPA: hypothetical protein VNJ01_14085 [Bacteriovoracaceae bacterium]|nr:hypothetical protein [Bacteriovoracaceae bacterium]